MNRACLFDSGKSNFPKGSLVPPCLRLSWFEWIRRLLAGVLLVVIMGIVCVLAFLPAKARAEREPIVSVETRGDATMAATINGGSGKVAVARAEAAMTYAGENLTAGVSYRREGYMWYNRHSLPFGNGSTLPWETLNRLALSMGYSGNLAEGWMYFVNASASASFEKQLDGSLGLRGVGGVVWQASSEWSVRIGAGVIWHKVKTYPIPVFGVKYKSDTIKGLSAEVAFPSSYVAYRISEMVGVRLTGDMDYGLYRLADDSSVRRKGYAEYWGYNANLWLELYPLRDFLLRVGGGWDFGGEICLYRENGEGRKEYTKQGAPRVSAFVKYDF